MMHQLWKLRRFRVIMVLLTAGDFLTGKSYCQYCLRRWTRYPECHRCLKRHKKHGYGVFG